MNGFEIVCKYFYLKFYYIILDYELYLHIVVELSIFCNLRRIFESNCRSVNWGIVFNTLKLGPKSRFSCKYFILYIKKNYKKLSETIAFSSIGILGYEGTVIIGGIIGIIHYLYFKNKLIAMSPS